MPRRIFENGDDFAPFLIISPKLGIELHCRNMIVSNHLCDALKLFLPVTSLIRMPLKIIEHPLLVPVKTHRANVLRTR